MFSLPPNQLASRTVRHHLAPAHPQLLSHSVEQLVVGPFSTAHKLVK